MWWREIKWSYHIICNFLRYINDKFNWIVSILWLILFLLHPHCRLPILFSIFNNLSFLIGFGFGFDVCFFGERLNLVRPIKCMRKKRENIIFKIKINYVTDNVEKIVAIQILWSVFFELFLICRLKPQSLDLFFGLIGILKFCSNGGQFS